MMNLVARCSERTTAALTSTTSERPEKTRHESQTLLWVRKLRSTIERWDPLFAVTRGHERHRPVVCVHSSSYSEWNIDKTWSFQEWKSDQLMDIRTERPVVSSQHTDQFVIEDDETESEMSLGSRSFLDRVNNQDRCRSWETRIRTVKNEQTRRWINVKVVRRLTRFTNASNLREWSIRKRGQSTIHQLYDGPSFSPWVRYQERKISWASIW